jgi:tetratricopeptide (TPR) repeat protein
VPNITQTEIPKPKSWDEFEDLVCDLYARRWRDPHADRYGRAGQRQHGVDICGRPPYRGGRPAGVQCKRYEVGTLTKAIIKAEVRKADQFRPPLAEYTIATTDSRDTEVQSFVLALCAQREAEGKFPVHIAFWETLCGMLAHPDYQDLLLKHYGEWIKLFGAAAAPITVAPLHVPSGMPADQEPAREDWYLAHPYPMPPNFTGRAAERSMLDDWLERDTKHRLLVLRALGGFGKSALAWHWLMHDVSPERWRQALWWSFYDNPDFEGFVWKTLEYLTGQEPRHLRDPHQQADQLVRTLHEPGILLVLDGFERTLHQYSSMSAAYHDDDLSQGRHAGSSATLHPADCVSRTAEHFLRSICALPGIQSKILMTTQQLPHILASPGGDPVTGCREVELTPMLPGDVVAFFRAQGVRGTDAAIEAACAAYGCHPLSLRILAGLVMRDPQQPGDIAAVQRLEVRDGLVQRHRHVLAQAYECLTEARQRVLGYIACFRGSIDYDTLRAVIERAFTDSAASSSLAGFDDDLRDLEARGLLVRSPRTGRFDLHPVVRNYAYQRLRSRRETHTLLAEHFRKEAGESPTTVFRRLPPRLQRLLGTETRVQVQSLEDLDCVIELYHHTVRAGRYDEAYDLFSRRLLRPIYYQFSASQLLLELLRALFPDGEHRDPALRNKSAQAVVLHYLAHAYSMRGEPRRSIQIYQRGRVLWKRSASKDRPAVDTGCMAVDLISTGALRAADEDLAYIITTAGETADGSTAAVAQAHRGRLYALRGMWAKAEAQLEAAQTYSERQHWDGLRILVSLHEAWLALLRMRAMGVHGNSLQVSDLAHDALAAAHRALALARADESAYYFLEPERIQAHCLLGMAHRAHGDGADAERHLREALTRCRQSQMVLFEADILLELARIAVPQGCGDEELELARLIAERSGYVLQGADVHLLLAQLALAQDAAGDACRHAKEALSLAACDGPPDYVYKVAYDEAGALLSRLDPGSIE